VADAAVFTFGDHCSPSLSPYRYKGLASREIRAYSRLFEKFVRHYQLAPFQSQGAWDTSSFRLPAVEAEKAPSSPYVPYKRTLHEGS
jgi:hypothetical protein